MRDIVPAEPFALALAVYYISRLHLYKLKIGLNICTICLHKCNLDLQIVSFILCLCASCLGTYIFTTFYEPAKYLLSLFILILCPEIKTVLMLLFLYYVYFFCIALPLALVATILAALTTIVGCFIGDAHFWGYHPGKYWSRILCFLFLIRVEVRGRENIKGRQSYVFVANHQGAFDIFLIYGYLNRNFKWMMKKSLRKIPLVGKACEAAGHIFVDRSGPRKVYETISKARATLVDGTSLVVFPEGARTFTGHMGYFKRGAFQLADELQMTVVPMTIDGSFEIMPRFKKLPKPHRLILTIHKPIPPIGEGAANIKHSMEIAYSEVESALPAKFKGMVRNEDQDIP